MKNTNTVELQQFKMIRVRPFFDQPFFGLGNFILKTNLNYVNILFDYIYLIELYYLTQIFVKT